VETQSDPTAQPNPTTDPDDRSATSRRWRSLFRIHFYAGMFAMPFILLMALSGLVILYTQPIQQLTQGDLRAVSAGSSAISYDVLTQTVETEFPGQAVTALTVPADSSHSVMFAIDDGSAAGMQVFVDPHTGKILGSDKPGSGIVGLANRLHGYLNNNSVQVSLPSIAALFDSGAVMRRYVVGDLILEMLGVWTLVLVMSGLFLWWPRRSPNASVERTGRGLLRVRLNKTGRARWRDLHGISGVLLVGTMVLTIVSGLAWSAYWGPNFTAVANKISPNVSTDAPASVLGTRGDLDRLGNKIPWNTGSTPIPASYATATDGTMPAPLTLDAVAQIADGEGMKPGYTINLPANAVDETSGDVVYGSFTVSNSWPRKTGEAHDLFLDQFSGQTLGEQTAYGLGAVSYGLDTLVSTHMGTQLGVVSRIMMTSLCVLSIWSIFSATVMFWKRRRPGTLGVPRRPVDVRLARRVSITAIAMAVLFPLWGLSAAVVLSFDRFVIRRNRRLAVTFGQR
jgi:uncharacterized iron-regulated membrane protein